MPYVLGSFLGAPFAEFDVTGQEEAGDLDTFSSDEQGV